MRRKIVLIVDDEPEIHELLKAYLSPLNLEIYSAYTGDQGVEIYRKLLRNGKKPHLVVMDLNLSGSERLEDMHRQMKGIDMDGVRATMEIFKIDRNANVIGFSAYAHLEWGKKLKEIGAMEVVGREVGFDGFAQKVSSILS
ncbi:MAG: response regulator [Thermoplasmata archaeon]|nr:response regulator [Thermoplasmata archaeon]